VKKVIMIFVVMLFASCIYGEEERLDLAKETKITLAKFVDKTGFYSTGAAMVPTTEADPAFVELTFPEKWTIVKIFIISGKSKVTSSFNGVKEVSTMYNFTLKTKTQYGDYKEIRKFQNNTQTKLEIKEKVKTDTLRIQMLPYTDGRSETFGDMAFEVWGYRGDVPKQEKIVIKTKADAKKALSKSEITAKEYMQLLKTLSE